MRPLKDWMLLKLWEPQAAALDVRIALPETVDRNQDEAAVFEVVRLGPEAEKVVVGDIVQMYGIGSISGVLLPNGNKVIVGRASDVNFIMEKEDLEKASDNGHRLITD